MTFLLVSVVAVSILGAVAYFAGRNILTSEITNNLEAISGEKETIVLNLLKRLKIETALIGDDRYLDTMFQKIVERDQNSPQLVKELIEYINGFDKNDPNIQHAVLLDLSGKVLVSTDEQLMGADRSDEEYFKEGMKGFHIRDVFQSKTTGQIGFVGSKPINGADGKTQIGVIAIHYNVNSLSNITSDRTGLGETGETYIANRDGLLLTETLADKDAVLKLKIDTELVRKFEQERKTMSTIYTDHHGNSVLGASKGNNIDKEFGLGWVVISRIDTSEAFAPIQKLGLTIAILGLIISVVVAGIAFYIASGIANPIIAISNAAIKASEGDLTDTIAATTSQDEIGKMTEAFGIMIANLKKIIAQILDTSERVSTSSQQLSSSAQEMNATSEEVSSTVQQIARGTETQAQKVDETQKVMEQMATAVGQVSKSSQDAAVQANRSSEIAQKGGDTLKLSQDKIAEVYEIIDRSNGMIKKLGERSDQIGEIVNVINSIADQTNLLALNAAIEAARAGEYGRGFAVVAEEVRKLAEGSAKASDEIGRLIKDIQKETAEAVKNMDESSKGATQVKDMSQKVGEAFALIVKNIENVAVVIEQVSASSKQQAVGAKQVVGSVSEIASVAEEIASSTQEASASTEEMTASMEEMSASAQELADMAMQLRETAAKFKTGEERSNLFDVRSEVPKLDVAARLSKLSALKAKTVALKKRMQDLGERK